MLTFFKSRSGIFGARSNPLVTTCRLLSIDSLVLGTLAESNIPNKKRVDVSKFLESLANCRIDSIGSGVDVISYDDKRGVGEKFESEPIVCTTILP
jgi:hypothetical protein